jgi:MFS family permease
MAQAAPESSARRVTFVNVLRNSGFRNLWLGQVVSQVGDYFAFLAMMVVVTGFSDDPEQTTLAVSGMTIALALPRLLFGMLAGVFVDRWDRRRIMIVSDVLRAGLTLALIPAYLTQNLWLLYALGFALSAVGTLFNPAKGALLPLLVPPEQLMSANALSQSSMMLATLIGPALGGATFALFGSSGGWVAFVIDSLSYLVSGVAIWRMRVPPQPPRERAVTAGVIAAVRQVGRELGVGLRAVFGSRVIALLAAVLGITMLGVGAINVLFLVFLKIRYNLTPAELAWRVSIIDVVFSAGMIAASVVVGNFLSHIAPKWLLVVALSGAGISILATPFMPDYWLMVALMLLMGAFVGPINTGVSTLVQIVVPNEQLGRVGGGIGTVSEVASITSMSLAGVLGAALGIPTVFVLGGLLCVAGGLLAWAALPALTVPSAAPAPDAPDAAEATLPTPDRAVRPEHSPSQRAPG